MFEVDDGGGGKRQATERRSDEGKGGASGMDLLDLFSQLVDKSLVMTIRRMGCLGIGCWRRCGSIVAGAVAAGGVDGGVRERHWDYFLRLAEEGAEGVPGAAAGAVVRADAAGA